MFDIACERPYDVAMADTQITARQREILDFIVGQIRTRGYPPSVREIGEAVGLTSPSTVPPTSTPHPLRHLRRDSSKHARSIRWDSNSGVVIERRPVRHVPLVRDGAAGTDVLAQENVEELLPVPADFCGEGELFMLRVRGDSMVELGILDGDFVVAVQQPTANNGEIVVVGIPDGEATVKTYQRKGSKVTLVPANASMKPMEFEADETQVYGRVVTVMRRL